MDDPRGTDYYEPNYDDVSSSGLLGSTLRNAAILVGLCLALAWAMAGVTSDEEQPFAAGGAAAGSSAGPGSDGQRADPDGLRQRADYLAGELLVGPGPRGHFLVEVQVDGTPVQFLVDTGASSVTLTAEDAERIGLPVRALDYSVRFQTANGEIAAAPVTLRYMRLGQFEISDVEATVTQAPLNISLLGMSFLNRLSGYEVRPDGLVMRF